MDETGAKREEEDPGANTYAPDRPFGAATPAVERACCTAGMEVGYIDDCTTHHVLGGEIHCTLSRMRLVGGVRVNGPNESATP